MRGSGYHHLGQTSDRSVIGEIARDYAAKGVIVTFSASSIYADIHFWATSYKMNTPLLTAAIRLAETIRELQGFIPELGCINLAEIEAAIDLETKTEPTAT